jgi:CelD/BcsL family acetyltransferase involved in cellulose biosynthesis
VWRHDYCFLGTPLVGVDRPEAALEALLAAGTTAASMMALEWLPTGGAVAAGVMAATSHHRARPVTYERFSRAATERGDTGPRLTLSSDRRRRLRRLSRKLSTAAGGDVRVVDRAGDLAAVERLFVLEAAGWKGRSGTALASRPGHADFVREVCRTFADAGRLRLHTLEAGDQVTAVICGLRAGDGLFLFKIAHDPCLGKYSPGTQLVVASSESSDAGWIDSGASPGETWLNDLFPAQRTIATLVVPPEGTGGKVLASGVGAFVAARDARAGRWLR